MPTTMKAFKISVELRSTQTVSVSSTLWRAYVGSKFNDKTISELIKFMKSSAFDSTEFVRLNLNRPTRFIRLIQTDKTCEDQLWDKRWLFHELNLMIKPGWNPANRKIRFCCPNGRALPIWFDPNTRALEERYWLSWISRTAKWPSWTSKI